jgi:hypothetical protein
VLTQGKPGRGYLHFGWSTPSGKPAALKFVYQVSVSTFHKSIVVLTSEDQVPP